MVRRSRKRRKHFPCGHQGFGQYCHRCCPSRVQIPVIANAVYDSTRSPKHEAKRQWQQSFTNDPIELRHLPKPIVIKTRQILKALNQGAAPGTLKGKHFNFDRTLLRIPVSYRYRLLCRWQAGRIVPLRVLSHEAYNPIAHNTKR